MNSEEQRPVSDYRLERYLLGELPRPEYERLRREIAADPGLGERLAALARSNEELHRRFPPEWMSGQIKLKLQRAGIEKPQRSGYRLWAVPVAALLLAVMVVPALFDRAAESPTERIKGGEEGPGLMIFRKLENGEERLREGALVRSGDLVQIVYRSGGMPYGAILSIDGRGAVVQHLPVAGEESVPLAVRDTLDFAYELDDAPRWERFFFVAADYRFGLAAIKSQLASGSELELQAGIRLCKFTLNKTRKP